MPIDWDSAVIGPLQGVFGEPVNYMPASGAAISITGIYDAGYKKDDPFADGSAGVTTVQPTLGVQLSQFSTPPLQNDRLSVPSVNTTFVVREVRTDSHGGARLLLNKVSTP